MKTKLKFFIAVFSAVFLFASCENFLAANFGFRKLLEEEVHDSTAKVLNVSVQAIAGQGNATSTVSEIKLNVTFMVSFDPDTSYGYFSEWKAYANYGKENQTELGADDILFSNPKSLTTEVTILKEYAEIRILPVCIMHPKINFLVPTYDSSEAGTISPFGLTAIAGDEPITVTVKMNDLYSFASWEVKNGKDTVKIEDYFNVISDNVSGKRADATLKLEIKDGANVDGLTITATTLPRPAVRTTSPALNATSVSRTTAITIVFTKPLNTDFISEEKYKDYFKIERLDSMISYEAEEVFNYFQSPKLSGNNQIVTFEPADKLNESNWLSPTSYVIVSVKGDLQDSEGILLGNDYVFSFTFGTTGDIEGPIVSDASLTFKDAGGEERTIAAASSTEAYWGDWMPNAGMAENHSYADSFRIKAAEGQKFSAQMTASDETTGNTGVKSYSVIQRLMYVSRGGRLPDTTRTAETDMTFFASDGSWNGLSGFLKADFEKEITLEEEGDGFKDFEFASFKDADGNYVDGIYMFELTARDGLGNKSGNPARYFVVRDNTAPNASENAAKISFGNCGVVAGGTRYFGRNYKTAKFKLSGNLADIGTQGQPWTASKPSNNKWSVALSSSAIEFVKVTDWTEWKSGSENHTVNIPESYFAANAGDTTLYAWAKMKDDMGNESGIVFLSDAILNIDVTAPKPSFGNNNYRLSTDSSGNAVLYKVKDGTLVFDFSDSFSGLKNIQFGAGGGLSEIANGRPLSVAVNQNYSVRAYDEAGNEYKSDFTVMDATSFTEVSVENVGYSYQVNKKADGSYSREFEEISVFNCSTNEQDTINTGCFSYYYKGLVGMKYKVDLGDEYLDEDGLRFCFYKDFDKDDYSKNIVPEKNLEMDSTYCYVRSYKLTRGSVDGDIIAFGTINDRNINYIPVGENTLKGEFYIDVICELGYKKTKDLGTDRYPELRDSFWYNDCLVLYAFNKVRYNCSPKDIQLYSWPPVLNLNGIYLEHDSDGNYIKDENGNYYCKTVIKEGAGDSYVIGRYDDGAELYDGEEWYTIIEIDGDKNKYFIFGNGNTITLPPDTKITAYDLSGNSISFYIKKITDDEGPKISIDAPYQNKDDYWYYDGTNVTVSFEDEKFSHVIYSTGTETKYSAETKIILTADDWNPVTYNIKAVDYVGNTTTATYTVRKDTNDGSAFKILGIVPDKKDGKEVCVRIMKSSGVFAYYINPAFYDYNDTNLVNILNGSNTSKKYEAIWNYKYDVKKFKGIDPAKPEKGDADWTGRYEFNIIYHYPNSVGPMRIVTSYSTKDGISNSIASMSAQLNMYSSWFSNNEWITDAEYRGEGNNWVFATLTDCFGRKFDATMTFTFE